MCEYLPVLEIILDTAITLYYNKEGAGTGNPTYFNMKGSDILETMQQKAPQSHPSPMKGKKLSEEEKAKRRELRQQRTIAREQFRADKEAAEKRRVASIEKLIDDERIDPNTRAQLVLVLRDEFPGYPRSIY